jgi:hypothetical protein
LRDEYESWCRSQGIKDPVRDKALGKALRALGCTADRRGGIRLWEGIDVRGSAGAEDVPAWVQE